jgi:hypothetical protein
MGRVSIWEQWSILVDIGEVNSRLVEPAVALTAIGVDIETGRATP